MKARLLRALLVFLGFVLVIAAVGPFLIPITPLEGVGPPEELADPDSRFIGANGVQVHYKTQGQGGTALVLLHGFGASLFSWREVMPPLAEQRLVVAFDRPAFGLTQRPMQWEGPNPYSQEAQANLTIALMDALSIEKAVLVGNSAGGSVSMLTALKYPERVQALVLVDPAVYTGGGAPRWVRPLLNLPQVDRLGPLFARRIQGWGRSFAESAWHDPSRLTPQIWEGYSRPLRVENWDRALWELTKASGDLDLPARLGELTLPVLVITGDDDRIVPTEQSVRLAGELPDARLVVIPNCGHIPQEECPEPFLEAVQDFLVEISE